MKYKTLTLIGTSHIAQQSIDDVTEVIEEEKPSIVALELDKKRLYSLLHRDQEQKIGWKDIKRIGFKGYMFLKIGAWAEKKLGSLVGVFPGAEMLTAYHLAKKQKIKVFLIDQDIEVTLKALSKKISWKEKWTFVWELLTMNFRRKPKYQFDLTKVPSKKLIKKLIEEVKQKYPNVYEVLIKQRNYVLAKNLAELMRKLPEEKIVAVIGAGHEEEIIALIKKYELHQIEHI